MMAAPGPGLLTLIDNREVSPAPVSNFAWKTRIENSRVNLPFNRSGSMKVSLRACMNGHSLSFEDLDSKFSLGKVFQTLNE